MAREANGGTRHGGPSIRSSLAAVKDTPRYTYLVAAMAAIGGMLFGYDIGVISGAENLLKTGFHLSSGTEELAVAAVLIGAAIGGVIGGPMANRFSRRYTLLVMAVLYAAGARACRTGGMTLAPCSSASIHGTRIRNWTC